MTNALKMPLAEWIYRMRIAHVPLGAVNIAFTAALFDVNSNVELEQLAGHTPGSGAVKKHKKQLAKDGWVIIPPNRGGRGKGNTIIPAVAETPVEFTDVSARNPGRIYSRLAKQTGVANTPLSKQETGVETTPMGLQTGVKTTPVSRARGNSNNNNPKKYNINNNNNNNNTNSAHTRASDPLPQFNFESEDVTFDRHGNVVLVNGLKQKWLEFFGDDTIAFEAALMAVNIDRGCRTPVEKQVAKQLQYAAQAARRNARGGRKPASSDMEKLKAITGEK